MNTPSNHHLFLNLGNSGRGFFVEKSFVFMITSLYNVLIMDLKTLNTIQHFVALDSIGPSALRNQGIGVISATREYLTSVNLKSIPRKGHKKFHEWLNLHTESLLDALPIKNRPWGAARKALNLFLRAALYNHYLHTKYNIGAIEPILEIPLDSVVAIAMKRHAGRGGLPRWPGLKHLTPDVSVQFQAYASQMSEEMKLPARIFLDNYLWIKNR